MAALLHGRLANPAPALLTLSVQLVIRGDDNAKRLILPTPLDVAMIFCPGIGRLLYSLRRGGKPPEASEALDEIPRPTN